MPVSVRDVDVAFQCILGRDPESDATINHFAACPDLASLISGISASPEAQLRGRNSPLWHYNTQIDAIAIIHSHENKARRPVQSRVVNYLGVIVDPAIYPPLLEHRGGDVEGAPIPANWHADIAEFAAALRAVDLASGTFRALELGCGWGCWLLNTGVAARNRGLNVELIGAEADEGHVALANTACAENGFSTQQYRIVRGIVGPEPGTALFPKQQSAGGSWGLEPVFGATAEQIALAIQGQQFDVLPIVTLNMLTDGQPLDLVHLDIQGGESKFIESCIDDLNRLVAYVVIGTHSRAIEGRICDIMFANGWVLEIERPAIFSFEYEKPVTRIDGVQGWRNPRIRAARD